MSDSSGKILLNRVIRERRLKIREIAETVGNEYFESLEELFFKTGIMS